MRATEREQTIQRILVALDASPHSVAALEAAIELATRLHAEVVGLFVEDINLLRVAELPFAQEIGVFSATYRRLDIQIVQRQLRAQASRVRQALAMIAEREHVRWSFRVARGVIAAELCTAAGEADLLIFGKAGWSRQRRLGSTARVLLSQASCLALILQQGLRLGLSTLVVYDGSPIAAKALVTAAHLIRGKEGYLTIIILAHGHEEARHLQTQVAQWLKERGLEARYRWVDSANVQALTRIVQEEKGLLVLPSESALLPSETLLTLLDEIESPVLVVR